MSKVGEKLLSCLLIGQHPPRLLQQTLARYSSTVVGEKGPSCLLIGQHPPRLLQQTLIRYSNTEVVTLKVILYLFKMFDKLSGYAVSGDRLSGINDAVQSKKGFFNF